MGTLSLLETKGSPQAERIERARRIFNDHGDEIVYIPVEHCWYVPSEHDLTSIYEVRLGINGGAFCECHDHEHRGQHCKHIYSAMLKKAATFACAGCRHRFPNRERHEVPEGNLTFFEGDALCKQCAAAHGGI